ncbi:hypothetical protein C8F04DRAFT_988152 [Mycena alexandri]|uniref:Uncharacterized protein n=1 Tax=Mycena alexandri TaxID=1745969 RepID=A0AAD6TMB1_9AGAR|nr:hypothetical protein C8F04DRAFT_988152 [Mycena alexandri]
MFTHIVKRGVAHLQAATPEYIAQLKADAEVYEQAGPEMEVNPIETLPILITAVFFLLLLASIRYTFGTVVATLAMVESPSTAAVEQTLPAYKDEEPLIPGATDKEADVESMVVNRKPLTSSLCATMRQLRSVGGPLARWRGAGMGVVHAFLHALVAKVLLSTLGGLLFGYTLFGLTLISILTSLFLVRVHLLWTHTIIAHPTPKSLLQRIVPRAQCKPLVVPTLVLAAAQHAIVLVPLGVAQLVRLQDITPSTALRTDGCALFLLALRILAIPTSAALVALFVLLPAAAARARVEAALLPADILSLVPIDRSTTRFTAAWRAFDRPARLRVLKVYAKMVGAQSVVAVVGMLIVAAEVYVIGGERLGVFFTAARAQLELMAIEG